MSTFGWISMISRLKQYKFELGFGGHLGNSNSSLRFITGFTLIRDQLPTHTYLLEEEETISFSMLIPGLGVWDTVSSQSESFYSFDMNKEKRWGIPLHFGATIALIPWLGIDLNFGMDYIPRSKQRERTWLPSATAGISFNI